MFLAADAARVAEAADAPRPSGNEKQAIAVVAPDLVDSQAKVAVEFISEQGHRAWELTETRKEDPNAPSSLSSVTSYDFPARARFVDRRVQSQATDQLRFAAFYDLLADTEALGKIREDHFAAVRALPAEDVKGHEEAYSRYASDLRAAQPGFFMHSWILEPAF